MSRTNRMLFPNDGLLTFLASPLCIRTHTSRFLVAIIHAYIQFPQQATYYSWPFSHMFVVFLVTLSFKENTHPTFEKKLYLLLHCFLTAIIFASALSLFLRSLEIRETVLYPLYSFTLTVFFSYLCSP
ncbi:hypothetical protein F5878DRAFT_615011 [Lentinula raphanica]|uniref:Uncharacterized protein n=1 Tax=Lentinula raphanica TaxID=153919 RepID=A0AA38PBH0_9AGAR|nr:hypothetical protein F5878DRAFT_615011 [Lentinula raphanica]